MTVSSIKKKKPKYTPEEFREMTNAKARKYRAENKDKVKEITKRSYQKRRENILARARVPYVRDKANERQREYYHRSDRMKLSQKKWRDSNSEKISIKRKVEYALNAEIKRAQARDYQKTNRAYRAAYEAGRRALQSLATPVWIDSDKVIEFYERARKLTEETGILHQVDHVVPLRSKIVCGLHWEGNLQVLTFEANLTKSNRVWPDMP